MGTTKFDSKSATRVGELALRSEIPKVLTVWVFGSVARGDANQESDLDLALLCERPLTSLERFLFAQVLATEFSCDIDLIDIQTVTSDLGAQISALDGIRFDLSDECFPGDNWENIHMSRYALLNRERLEIVSDIKERKSVYG